MLTALHTRHYEMHNVRQDLVSFPFPTYFKGSLNLIRQSLKNKTSYHVFAEPIPAYFHTIQKQMALFLGREL